MQEFWLLRATGVAISPRLHLLQGRTDIFVSPHTKLCTSPSAAHLSSRELVEEFAWAILEVMQRRHGAGLRLEVMFLRSAHRRPYDDALVHARIAAKAFAPNKAPRVPRGLADMRV